MEKLKANIYFFQWIKHRTFYQNLTFLMHQTINTNSSLPTSKTYKFKKTNNFFTSPLEEIKFRSSKDQEVIASPFKMIDSP